MKSSQKQQSHHIVLDVASKDVKDALSTLLLCKEQVKKVTSADIILTSTNANTTPTPSSSSDLMSSLLKDLGRLSALETLSIDLYTATDATVTIRSLASLLKKATKLRCLHLKRLSLVKESGLECLRKFQKATGKHPSLEHVTLEQLELLEMYDPEDGSRRFLYPFDKSAFCLPWSQLLSAIVRIESLKTLVLKDLYNLVDNDVVTLAHNIAFGSSANKLQQLHLVSSVVGDIAAAGEAISSMLLVNETIKSVTFDLGAYWEGCGSHVADAIRSNSHMQRLSLGLRGTADSVLQDVLNVAEALQQSPFFYRDTISGTRLEHLDLYLKIKDDVPEAAILEAFQDALSHNESLGRLNLFVGRDDIKLPAAMKFQLDLNRFGLRGLFRYANQQEQKQPSEQDQLNALISHKNNIAIVFHIVSQNPSLCIQANLFTTNASAKTKLVRKFGLGPKSESNSRKFVRRGENCSRRNKMLSFWAPSA